MTGDATAMAAERLVLHEARLLDEQRWDEWNALFAEDGLYWIPAEPGQADGRNAMSLMHDDALLRAVRIRRFADRGALPLQPAPRGWRQVTNIIVEPPLPSGEILVGAKMLAAEYRREVVFYPATLSYRLVNRDGGLKIALKRVDLLDCDASRGDLLLYL